MKYNIRAAHGILKSIEDAADDSILDMSTASWTSPALSPEEVMYHYELLVEARMIKANENNWKIAERLTLKGHEMLLTLEPAVTMAFR